MAALKRICHSRILYPSLLCTNNINLFHHSSYRFCNKNDNNKEKDDENNDEKKQEKSFFSQIEDSWQKAKDEMARQEEQQKSEYSNNIGKSTVKNDWIEKYSTIKQENEFQIESLNYLDIKVQWEYFSITFVKDPLTRFAMNSWLTGFSDRFLFYEEFMCGVIEGFEFIMECLEENQFDDIKDCFVNEVFQHIKQLKQSLLKDGYTLDKLRAYIYNVRVDRERIDLNQIMQKQKEEKSGKQNINTYSTPVELFFDVKYYCQFVNDSGEYHYKIIDILWHSKYEPVTGERLKYQISKPWCINHITVSVISHA